MNRAAGEGSRRTRSGPDSRTIPCSCTGPNTPTSTRPRSPSSSRSISASRSARSGCDRPCSTPRARYVDLLLEEVAASLEEPTVDRLGEELADLGLLEYCRGGLERYRVPF